VRFDYIEGESLVMLLDMEGIACSTGSACSSYKLEPSYVLLATGIKPEQAHGSLRITLGRFTTEKEINYLLKILPGIISKLRKISPFK
jgi:cysteine desulfurase